METPKQANPACTIKVSRVFIVLIPSLISPMVSVDVNHHVYLLIVLSEPVWPSGKALGW